MSVVDNLIFLMNDNIQNYYTVSSTGIKAFGENVRLGSDLLLQSNLNELGIKQETLAC